MQSKVSMVMPCYNKVEYIADMFDSILAQDWDNIELILVNDGSTDGTREVIVAYEPKLRERGYDVLLIDQANAGVCAAAKTGLERITGDYACMIDADDELDPHYVSAMADWLDQHGEDDYTACGYQTYTLRDGNKNFSPYFSQPLSERKNDRMNLRYYLLSNICMSVWVYLVRVSYLRKCMIARNYSITTRGSHEPGYIIPLLAGGGKAKFIDQPLYHFNILEESHSKTKQYRKFVDHWNEYERLVNLALEPLPTAEKKQLQRCFLLTKYRRQIAEYSGDSAELFDGIVSEATRFLNDLDFTNVFFDEDTVRTGHKEIFNQARTQQLRRVVGYGAKWNGSEALISRILGTRCEPTEFWDESTSDDETSIFGFPIFKPDYGCLKNTDVVVVFGKKAEVFEEIQTNLIQCKGPVKVLFADELRFSDMRNIKMQKKVSMIVPCFNKEEYIDAFIQSVYDQEYDNIELIFVNDGSTDGTKEKIDLWAPRLVRRGYDVIIVNQTNQGVGTAVHAGLRKMTGEYLCMPDCDDALHSDYVVRMASVLDNDQSVQWVQCNAESDAKFSIFYKYSLLEAYLLHSFFWTVWSKMVRRSYFDECKILEKYIDSRTTQECQIFLPLVLGGKTPYIIEENLYDYRIISSSIMGKVKSEKEKIYQHWEDMKNLNLEVLKLYGACSERNSKLCEIIMKKLNWNGLRDSESYDALFETICESNLINSKQIEILKKYKSTMSAEHIFLSFKYMIFGVEPTNDLALRLKESRRLIGCAVMSETARDFLGVVLEAGVRLDVFWDQSAADESMSFGMNVYKPDYSSVTEEDTIIIFAKKANVINEIKSLCNTKWVFGYNDLVQYLCYAAGRT